MKFLRDKQKIFTDPGKKDIPLEKKNIRPLTDFLEAIRISRTSSKH